MTALAELQRLPAAIQLLLKATSKKGRQRCQQYRTGGRRGWEGEGEQEGVKDGKSRRECKMKYGERDGEKEMLSQDTGGCREMPFQRKEANKSKDTGPGSSLQPPQRQTENTK